MNFPVIPTQFTNPVDSNGNKLKSGWYGVRVNEMGIEEVITDIRYTDFSVCKKDCDQHNENIGMSIYEISLLYFQRRWNDYQIA